MRIIVDLPMHDFILSDRSESINSKMSPISGRTPTTINIANSTRGGLICKSRKCAAPTRSSYQSKANQTKTIPRNQQIRMFKTTKRDLSNDCAVFLLILLASVMVAYIECDPGSSVFNKQQRHLWQAPLMTLALDELTNQIKLEQQRRPAEHHKLLECQLNNGIICLEATMINYNSNNQNKRTNSEREPMRTTATAATITNTKRNGVDKNGKGLDASHLLREIYLDSDSMVLLLPGNEDKDSTSVQKFIPNGRYGRRSSNDFPLEPYHDEASKTSVTGKPVNLMSVNRQFRGSAVLEPMAPMEIALADLERLENAYRTMRQQIGDSNKRSSAPASSQNVFPVDNNRVDEAGFMDTETRDSSSNNNLNNCNYSGFAGLILCH